MSMEKLVVFDLDFTLWNCGGTWCDCTDPPYKIVNNQLQDRAGRRIFLYDGMLSLLKTLNQMNIKTATASRTEEPAWAKSILMMLEIYDFFQYHEIYPGSKIRHFESLKARSGVSYENMIFFDDEFRNIKEIQALGVFAVYVQDSDRIDIPDVLYNWLGITV
ncbi:MAG: magnesium-dependent phosphatase-1 [Spirochaetes bacterium]|nr:magnesium-dependent phosphatase-1 [Spirochaetota bacterium]